MQYPTHVWIILTITVTFCVSGDFNQRGLALSLVVHTAVGPSDTTRHLKPLPPGQPSQNACHASNFLRAERTRCLPRVLRVISLQEIAFLTHAFPAIFASLVIITAEHSRRRYCHLKGVYAWLLLHLHRKHHTQQQNVPPSRCPALRSVAGHAKFHLILT